MAKTRLYALQKIKSARSIAIQQLVHLESEKSRPGFDDDAMMAIESAQDHRQVKEYVAGITRWKRWLDFVLAAFYNGEFEKLEPIIVQILRLGAYDLLFLSTPAHAAINESVELAKQGVHPGAGGLINGVLRSVDRERETLPTPRKKIRANELGVRYSHPNWMIYRWLKRYPDTIEDLLEWNNTRPAYTVRINTQKQTTEAFTSLLDAEDIDWEPTNFLEDFIRVPKLQPLVRRGLLRDGQCAVQDESSGLIVRLLDPKPGETVVDTCAAPGGKTFYAASLMKGEGVLHALDVQSDRLKKLTRVIDRYGAGWVQPKVIDLRDDSLDIQADKVLLDAPCTGLGVLSKRADLRWKRTLEDLTKIVELQQELMDGAARMVKPGGYLVYSTCSIEPEENELQIKKFLARNSNFELENPDALLPAAVVNAKGFLSTFPPKHKMDGVFGARLKRVR